MILDKTIQARCNSDVKKAAKLTGINISEAATKGVIREICILIKSPESKGIDQAAEKYLLHFLEDKRQDLIDELQETQVYIDTIKSREENRNASLLREHRETVRRMESEERINTIRQLQQQIRDILANRVPEEKRAEIGSYAGKDEVHRKIQVLTKQVKEDLSTEIPPSFNIELEVDNQIFTMWGGLSA